MDIHVIIGRVEHNFSASTFTSKTDDLRISIGGYSIYFRNKSDVWKTENDLINCLSLRGKEVFITNAISIEEDDDR
jgi:hypothetical protein